MSATIAAVTGKQVAITVRVARLFRDAGWSYLRTDAELAQYIAAAFRGLRALELVGLAEDVRLPATAVRSVLWAVVRAAKAEQARRRDYAVPAEEPTPIEVPADVAETFDSLTGDLWEQDPAEFRAGFDRLLAWMRGS
jgi:hypothetical protein